MRSNGKTENQARALEKMGPETLLQMKLILWKWLSQTKNRPIRELIAKEMECLRMSQNRRPEVIQTTAPALEQLRKSISR